MKLGSPELRAQAHQWHGSVPPSWAVRRFKQVAAVREGQVDPEDDRYRALPLFAPNHIESGTGRILDVETATDQGAESGKYLVDAGDVLYSKIRPALRKVAIAPSAGLCSADMYPVKPGPELDARFLFYSMLSEGFFRYSVLESARVAMPKINREALGEVILLVPPRSEQRAIAAFLDQKTTAIDALVDKKESLVEALHERSKADAAERVARGLDPRAPLRSSGVAWLGSIPSHWEVLRTRRVCSLTTGSRDTQDAVPEGAYPFFVRSQNIERIDSYSFDGEGVLTAGDGVGSVAKVFHHYVGKFEFHQRMYLYYGFTRVLGRYYYYFLRAWLAAVAKAGNSKITVDSLRRPMLLDFPITVPPLSEQREIVAFLDEGAAETQRLTGQLRRQIDTLREYRQALITAAVTGRLGTAGQEAA